MLTIVLAGFVLNFIYVLLGTVVVLRWLRYVYEPHQIGPHQIGPHQIGPHQINDYGAPCSTGYVYTAFGGIPQCPGLNKNPCPWCTTRIKVN